MAKQGSDTAVMVVEDYWRRYLELHPLYATLVGVDLHDHLLPDPGIEGRTAAVALAQGVLVQIRSFDQDALDFEGRAAVDMAESIARRELEFYEHRLDRLWAAGHLVSGAWFGPAALLAEIIELQPVTTAEQVDRYLLRLEGLPSYLEALTTLLEEGMGAGQVAAAVVVDRTMAQIERLLKIQPAASDAITKVPQSFERERERVMRVLEAIVYPGYANYLDALRLYRSQARDSIGMSALPNGKEAYDAEIRGWTTLAIGASEIHELGIDRLADASRERTESARALGHDSPRAAIEAYDASGANRLSSPEEVLRFAEDRVARSWEAAARFFGRLPQRNCEVRPIDGMREEDVQDYYSGPSGDGSRPGVFYVNTTPRPLHSLASTSFHEANPGHHFQMSLDIEASERPALRRFATELQGAAYGEGWALYSERLADEMGLYESDYERLGMLELQALRAARLVVDTGIHAFGWSRERAIETIQGTGLPRRKAESEVDRYIAVPGQALCYMLGQIEIQSLRSEAERRQGTAFDVRSFHDRLLSFGSLPLPALRRVMGRALSSRGPRRNRAPRDDTQPRRS